MYKFQELIDKLTLEEKAALLSGITFWRTTPIARLNIPSVKMTDGPHGLRQEAMGGGVANVLKGSIPSTCFPTAVTTASAWNRKLMSEIGKAIAEEAMDQGVQTVLGPGVNIKRNPLCGRNFEYISEDPFLAGELSANFINGVQSTGIGTSLKHFAVNSQENGRMTISSELDERALREIYLSAFERAVKKSQPATIMCSYNPINGIQAAENKKILTDILRDEWGFKGIVMSDWGAVNQRVEGVPAGLDLEMPSSNGERDKEIVEAVKAGTISEDEVNVLVDRVLNFIFNCYTTKEKTKDYKADYAAHHKLARKAAAQGAVLLKNAENFLPLNKEEKIAVIGKLAKSTRYQGSGSSRINPKNLVSFTDYLDSISAKYDYAEGYPLTGDGLDTNLIEEAVKVAKENDKVILFAGLTDNYESEGFDRTHLDMPDGHNQLIDAVSKVNPNVVVVLECGSPVVMPWLENVKSLLNVYLGGEAGGEACYDLLFGDANPSGKLAETFPKNLSDFIPDKYFNMGPHAVEYRESIYVGYRYYDTAKKDVLFPFGYGLSYTNFKYSGLRVANTLKEGEDLTVTFKVKNTGKVSGAEIAQVYVKDIKSSIFMPEKQLAGFERIELKAGEEKEISVNVEARSFAFFNEKINDWSTEGGEFEIMVGASSRDIKLSSVLTMESSKVDILERLGKDEIPVYYNVAEATDFPRDQYVKLMGREPVSNEPTAVGSFTLNSTLGETSASSFGKFFYSISKKASKLALGKNADPAQNDMVLKSIGSMPIRNLYAMSGGILTKKMAEGLLMMFNKHFFKGLGKLIGGAIFNRPKKKIKVYPTEE